MIEKIARENAEGKVTFCKERYVCTAVREYEMLQNIGGKSIEAVAEFFGVQNDEITFEAWVDFMRGLQKRFENTIYCLDYKES